LSDEGIALRGIVLADAFFQVEEELAESVLVLKRSNPEQREILKTEKR